MPPPLHCGQLHAGGSLYCVVTNTLIAAVNLKPLCLWQQLELKLHYYCSFKLYL